MNDWLNIKGKTVLVTGASSGIGKAIVEELLELGVNVANFDLSDNDLRHPNLLFVKVDVTSRSEVEEGVAKIVERFGNIDAVVNNAGINIPRLLIDAENPKGPYELDDETFEKVTMINQKGLYLVSQAVGRILVKNCLLYTSSRYKERQNRLKIRNPDEGAMLLERIIYFPRF